MRCSNSFYPCAIIAALLMAVPALAQNESTLWPETGLPLIQNYRPTDYHAGPNNYAIAQDERGLRCFANNQGVLVFDGVRWQLIRFVRLSRARQLLEQQHDGTVSEIAYQVGFSNLSYFARVFREEFGELPSEM